MYSEFLLIYLTRFRAQFDGIPLRLHLLVMNIVFLTKPEHISLLFRQSELTNKPYRRFVSSTFGVPDDFQKFFTADNTGLSRTPLPGTMVAPENRVDYLMHSYIVEFMSGPSLKPLAKRFAENMGKQLMRYHSKDTDHENLYDFIKMNMFHVSAVGIFGTELFEIDPEFSEHFWDFEKGVPELAKGFPRFFYPKKYRARDICLKTMRAWHKRLDEYRAADPDRAANLSLQEYDDILGCRIVKKRHAAFAKMEVMSDDARASEDLALLWGANANATHAAFWLVHSIISDGTVQKRFLEEIQVAEISPRNENFATYDVDSLCSIPYLQSLYAETLRLYVANMVLRTPRSRPISLDGWRIQQGELVATMSYPMHRDQTRFNTGTIEDPHPLSEFWADRFLTMKGVDSKPTASTQSPLEFSLNGTEGAWIPYGGGSNACPGRFFAKQEMLLTAAMLIGNYNIQLNKRAEVDWRYFGSGVLGVKGKQPFKLQPRVR